MNQKQLENRETFFANGELVKTSPPMRSMGLELILELETLKKDWVIVKKSRYICGPVATLSWNHSCQRP